MIAVAIVIRAERVLVQERFRVAKGRVFEFPCGKIDAGETPEQAAMRELFEETGLSHCAYQATISRQNAEGVAIHFVVLQAPVDQEPYMTNPDREQVFYWLKLNEIPVTEFLQTDQFFIQQDLNSYLIQMPLSYRWLQAQGFKGFMPWQLIDMPGSPGLRKEFQLETGELDFYPFARRQDCDDVAGFEVIQGQIQEAVISVHLTWVGRKEREGFPSFSRYKDLFEWFQQELLPDTQDWMNEEELNELLEIQACE